MAQPNSTLGSLMAQRRRLQASREALGLTERGIKEPMQGPPPKAPADSRGPQTVQQEQFQIPEEQLKTMRAKAEGFLEQMRAGGQGAQGRATQRVVPVDTTGGNQVKLEERMRRLGAGSLPAEQQFYRVAGRAPSPRELEIFNSRRTLEKQLGRVPTAQELRQYIVRPQSISPAVPTAFESEV